MISPESTLHQPAGKVPMPQMPGIDQQKGFQANPFQGIRRAGQAKRAQNFEKWQNLKNGNANGATAFQGMKTQNFGGLAGTQNGSMRQNKSFS